MRRKIIYLSVLICSVSMITAARQQACNMNSSCKIQMQENSPGVIKASQVNQHGFDMSPLQHFVFNI